MGRRLTIILAVLILFTLGNCSDNMLELIQEKIAEDESEDPQYSNSSGITKWGADGFVVFDSGGETATIYSFIQDDQGFIYGVGNITKTGQDHNLLLVRYNNNGIMDSSFGNNGFVTYNGPVDGYDGGSIIRKDDNGYIFIGGQSLQSTDSGATPDSTVWKYDTNGNLVSDYGSGGIITIRNDTGGKTMNGFFALDEESGTVYMTGGVYGGIYTARLFKFNEAGIMDTAFGTSGYYEWTGDGWTNYAEPLEYLEGSIFWGTYSFKNGDNDNSWGGFIKINTSGNLVTSFGSSGWLKYPDVDPPVGASAGAKEVILSDGKMLHSGRRGIGGAYTHYTTYIIKCDSSGALDSSFGTDGEYVFDPGYLAVGPSDLFVNSEGYIYAAVSVKYDGTNYERVLFRLTSDGVLDSSYGTGGIFRYSEIIYPGITFLGEGEALITGELDGKLTIIGIDKDGGIMPGND